MRGVLPLTEGQAVTTAKRLCSRTRYDNGFAWSPKDSPSAWVSDQLFEHSPGEGHPRRTSEGELLLRSGRRVVAEPVAWAATSSPN